MRILLTILFVFMLLTSLKAQDIHFSQYYNSPLNLNPAFAGNKSLRINNVYRSQWRSVAPKTFSTYSLSADMPFKDENIGAGIAFFSDKAGDSRLGTTQFMATVATNVEVRDYSKLYFGIAGAFVQKSITYDDLYWDSQFTGRNFDTRLPSFESPGGLSHNFFDISAGMLYEYYGIPHTKIITGVSAWHLTTPTDEFYSTKAYLPMKGVFHFECEYHVPSFNMYYIPRMTYSIQESTNEYILGVNFRYKKGMDSRYTGINVASFVTTGLHYRYNDSFILYFAYTHERQYTFAFSYDFNVSDLSAATNLRGGVELSLIYTLHKKNKLLRVG